VPDEARAPHAGVMAEDATAITLNIDGPVEDVGALADAGILGRVRRVEFVETGTATVVNVLRSLPHVRSVTFVEDQHAMATVRAIDTCLPHSVQSLNFAGFETTTFNDSVAVALCRSPRMAQLRHLALYNCNLRQRGALAIANGTFRCLEALHLGLGHDSANRVGANGAGALAQALPHLRTLDLSFNAIGDRGARVLCRARKRGCLRSLEELYLQGNGITDVGLAALRGSPLAGHVVDLDL
jgi:hypothetical protein